MTDRSTGRTVVFDSKSTAAATARAAGAENVTMENTNENVGYALMYSEYGNPTTVLRKEEFPIPSKLEGHEVLVKILAAPINPSDYLCILGLYAAKPPLPATGGFEGVGEVIKVGDDVTDVKVGDWVIPGIAEITGTWRTHAVWNGKTLRKIPNDIPVLSAATIAVNPSTAYRMLHDFVQLKPGDAVVQNAANSGVGEAVIQICRFLEVVTINVVRSRPDIDELRSHLTNLGADYVVTEEELRSEEFINSLKVKPKLALDCVGGKSASDLLDTLAPKGIFVNYGMMSGQPITVSAQNLVFKDVSVRGFWMSLWKKINGDSPEATQMNEFLCKLIRDGKLLPPKFEEMQLDNYQSAMQKAMSGYKGVKPIFVMKKSDVDNKAADIW